jgi:hypothetical protein
MPLFYHGRLNGNTDRHWIESRMIYIPADKQQAVADEYSKIFLSHQNVHEARRAANTWLNSVARGYRGKAHE